MEEGGKKAPSNMSFVQKDSYRSPSRLVILGGAEIQSTEGTTHGDNLAMSFYALATVQIQNRFRITASGVKQVWLADYATGAGSLESLKKWWINIIEESGRYGYYVNESKSWLILKNQTLLKRTESLFSDTKINVTTKGKRQLGAVMGSNDFGTKYVNEKVIEWCKELRRFYQNLQNHNSKPPMQHFVSVNRTNLVTFYEPYQK